jgi:inosine-uridine nucleoside N-ribohydrolase
MAPRDITLDLFLDPEILKPKAQNSELQRTVYELAKKFLEHTSRSSLRLSDPIAVGSLLFPDLFKSERVELVREKSPQGEVFYCARDHKSNITGFHDFNREEFYQRLCDRL